MVKGPLLDGSTKGERVVPLIEGIGKGIIPFFTFTITLSPGGRGCGCGGEWGKGRNELDHRAINRITK